MNWIDLIWGVVGSLLTVMVLSYLIGDSFFFRLATSIFIGLTSGYLVVLILNQIIWPYMINPLITGTGLERLWLLVPLAMIILLLLGQIPSLSGVGSIPLAYLAGLTAAIAIGGAVFGTLIPQSRAVIDAFDPSLWYAVPGQTWLRILDAGVMLIGTVGTLSYFHFGQKRIIQQESDQRARPRLLEFLGSIGQVFIGIALGAVFAGVFSTALLALIDRIFFISQFISSLFGVG